MTDELSALDLWRWADNHYFSRQDTPAEIMAVAELFAASLRAEAEKIDPRIEVPPIRWGKNTDGKDYWAYRNAEHDRNEWLEWAKESLRKGVFLADVPLGWEGEFPRWPLHTNADFADWLRYDAIPVVQGFQSKPDRDHLDRQLRIAQKAVRNANTWLALHLQRQIPLTPSDIAECARQLVNLLVAFSTPEKREPVSQSSEGLRQRRTKEETTKLVNAAIAFKMKNPSWSESKCAEEAGLPVTTLHGNTSWQDWKRKIDIAQNGGTLSAVKHEFDRRTGEFLPVNDSDSDDSDGDNSE